MILLITCVVLIMWMLKVDILISPTAMIPRAKMDMASAYMIWGMLSTIYPKSMASKSATFNRGGLNRFSGEQLQLEAIAPIGKDQS